MKTAKVWFRRHFAVCLMMLLVTPPGGAKAALFQETPAAPKIEAASAVQVQTQGTEPADASLPDSPRPAAAQGSNSSGEQNQDQPGSTSQAAVQQPSAPQQPMGTAAAPYEPGTGVAASRPSGAAIAPARQKRTRSFAIRVALVVGAAVAVGTVVALSSASPSRPAAQ